MSDINFASPRLLSKKSSRLKICPHNKDVLVIFLIASSDIFGSYNNNDKILTKR